MALDICKLPITDTGTCTNKAKNFNLILSNLQKVINKHS